MIGPSGDRAATEASFDEEGRFRTGDVGERDERGYVRLLGRASSDIIKSGGYKLSALEIEDVLREHPAIAEVAVIGVADETWGERVCGASSQRRPRWSSRSSAPGARSEWPSRSAARAPRPRCAAAQRDGQGAEEAPG